MPNLINRLLNNRKFRFIQSLFTIIVANGVVVFQVAFNIGQGVGRSSLPIVIGVATAILVLDVVSELLLLLLHDRRLVAGKPINKVTSGLAGFMQLAVAGLWANLFVQATRDLFDLSVLEVVSMGFLALTALRDSFSCLGKLGRTPIKQPSRVQFISLNHDDDSIPKAVAKAVGQDQGSGGCCFAVAKVEYSLSWSLLRFVVISATVHASLVADLFSRLPTADNKLKLAMFLPVAGVSFLSGLLIAVAHDAPLVRGSPTPWRRTTNFSLFLTVLVPLGWLAVVSYGAAEFWRGGGPSSRIDPLVFAVGGLLILRGFYRVFVLAKRKHKVPVVVDWMVLWGSMWKRNEHRRIVTTFRQAAGFDGAGDDGDGDDLGAPAATNKAELDTV